MFKINWTERDLHEINDACDSRRKMSVEEVSLFATASLGGESLECGKGFVEPKEMRGFPNQQHGSVPADRLFMCRDGVFSVHTSGGRGRILLNNQNLKKVSNAVTQEKPGHFGQLVECILADDSDMYLTIRKAIDGLICPILTRGYEDGQMGKTMADALRKRISMKAMSRLATWMIETLHVILNRGCLIISWDITATCVIISLSGVSKSMRRPTRW